MMVRKNSFSSFVTTTNIKNSIEGKEATVIKDKVQCIIQQNNTNINDSIINAEFKLNRGDIITIERELKQLNLV